jgi:PAS domain S-box-containing protein
MDRPLTRDELRYLLDLSRELLVVFDPSGEIHYLSRAWDQVLGYEPSTLDRANLRALVHEDDRDTVGQRIRTDMAAGQEEGTFVVRMIHRDGSERLVDWTWRLDKALSLFFALGRDVTAEQAATEGLRSAEARIVSLINRMADPSMGLDRDGRVVYLNDPAVERFGRSRNDLLGRSIWEDFGVAGTRFETEYRAALADGQPRQFEEFAPLRGQWIEVRVIPDQHGFGITYRDVSSRHDLEERLRQSQKMEAIGRLAGGIAHDFNNLLTAIIGYAELLEDAGLSEADLASLAAIRRAADRAATLTGQLLAFGRRQILDPTVLDANDVVAEFGSLVERLVGEGVTVQTNLSPEPSRIKADASQLDQILVNLAVNARDAMPEGGTLTIEVAAVELDATYAATHPEVTPGQYVMLAVSDSGIGMSPEVQAQIFEPFFTTKGPGLGTGLGLATVFGIVKQSGGSIGVYSELGRGTVFKIFLPRVHEALDYARDADVEPINLEGTETILVAEDDEAVRNIAIMALRRHGYEILAASSGEEALDIARKHDGPIHLLITDVVMRGMSGRELADALILDRPILRTLYVSGYTENTIVHHGVLEPGIWFLAKPFTPVLLARRVREVFTE